MPKGIPKNGINKSWFKKGNNNWVGRKHKPETIEKFRQAKLGKKEELANNWHGDKVKYSGLHVWIGNKLGRPQKCEFCNLNYIPEGMKRYFQWANKSGEYKRDVNDWIRLCVKCHMEYDSHKQGEYSNAI